MKRNETMRTIKALMLVSCITLLTGCWTLSIHPIYTADDVIFYPQLVGAWGDTTQAQDKTWIFEQADNKAYRLVTREQGNPDGVFEAHLVQLQDHVFLDIFPEEPAKDNEFYTSHLIPAHTIWSVTFEGRTMTLAPFSNEWLNDGIKNKILDIAHIREDEVIIFTAPTAELQQFILAHIDEAFEDDPFVLYHKNW